jgi:hypothetical protein
VKFSYIEAREKKLITPEVALVLSFFTVIFVFIFGVLLYLSFKIDAFEQRKKGFTHEREQVEHQIKLLDNEIAVLKNSILKAEKIDERNKFVATSIKNLFQIIPDKITLSKVNMKEKELILYGITPTKDIYNLRLLAPLKAIFDKSYTSFYLQENGWYKFVSYNSMDNNLTIFRNK